ncbi:hypothetical protein BDFG_09384, partial [Blastomyces dermatitidis ATCC 26199]
MAWRGLGPYTKRRGISRMALEDNEKLHGTTSKTRRGWKQRRQRTPLLSVLFLGTPGGDFTRSHFAMPANRIGARPFRPVSAAELGWFMQPGLFEVATTIKTMMNPSLRPGRGRSNFKHN